MYYKNFDLFHVDSAAEDTGHSVFRVVQSLYKNNLKFTKLVFRLDSHNLYLRKISMKIACFFNLTVVISIFQFHITTHSHTSLL